MNRLIAISLVLLLCASSVPFALSDDASAPYYPATDSGRPSPAVFANVTASAGLSGLLGDSYAWGDYDNDGCDDLLVKGNRLFKNSGPPKYVFTEVTQQAGIGTAYGYAVWGDYNNDGYLDFFCCGQDEKQRDSLWRNLGAPDFRFVNASVEAGGMDDGLRPSLAPAWVDYDRDGFIDIYIMNWRDAAGTCYADVLWHNDGDGTFTDVTATAGIVDRNPATGGPNAGMGVDCADYNNDGWPDIYAGNYLLGNNYLWHNNHDGTFSNFGDIANLTGDPDYYTDGSGPYYGHTAGSAWGDYNNDGLLDLWVGNLAHKDTDRAPICDDPQLMRNLGLPYRFEDFKERAGMPNIPAGSVKDGQWYDDDTFGGAWCDFDNDGWLDLYVPQVKGYHSWAFAQLWHNDGDGTFTEVGGDAGIRVWAGIGCAWADYNNDGQPDHITEGTYPYQGPRECHLFENQGTANHWLKVHLTGTVSNRAAIGARVTVSNGTLTQIREVEGGTGGHAHQSSLTQMFGFGAYSGTVTVEVRWPSGIIQNISSVALDRTLNITEGTAGPRLNSVWISNVNPGEGEEVDLTFAFSGEASTFMWDFEGDGSFDRTLPKPGATRFSYDRPGRYYPKIRVMMLDGRLGSEESSYITVKDVPPIARAGGDRSANETEPITFDAGASGGDPRVLYRWSFNDGCQTGWLAAPDFVRSFDRGGPYTVTLGLRDDEGTMSNDTAKITIWNLPPSVLVRMGNLTVEDTPLEFSAAGNDTAPDLPFLRYRWRFGDGSDDSPILVSPRFKHAYTQAGEYRATVTVTDDDGAKAEASIGITVANLPPAGTVELADVDTVEDAALTLVGAGSDTPSDQNGLTYRWDFGDGNASDWFPDPAAAHTYTMGGNYSARFFVRDHMNATVNATTRVRVRNLPPSCSVTTPDQEVAEDSEVSFDGTARDTPTDALSLSYLWDFGDESVTAWSTETGATHAYRQKGVFEATLTVRDMDGARATAKVEITVANVLPVAKFKASRTTVDEDTPVMFNASESTDTPSDIPLLGYTWDFGDGKDADGISTSHSYTKQKTYRVVLTVTDDDGESSTLELGVKVTNPAPWIKASAENLRVAAGKAVGFGAEGGDTESDNSSLRFEWNFGDRATALGKNVSHTYLLEGRYTVKATVTDDEGAVGEETFTIEVVKAAEPAEPAKSGPPWMLIGGAAAAAVLVLVIVAALMLSGKRKAHVEQAEADAAKKST